MSSIFPFICFPHGFPAIAISMIVQPKDHISAFRLYPFWRITSGAIQGIVPFIVDIIWFILKLSVMTVAHPKSESFAQPFESISTFAPFRS